MKKARVLSILAACSLFALAGSALASEGPPKPKCAVAGEVGSPDACPVASASLAGLLLVIGAAALRRRG